MATRWTDPPDEDDRKKYPAGSTACEAKQRDGGEEKGRAEGVDLAPGQEEEELFSWPGPKTLRLRRTSLGFGFTLRHFIVYPPESAIHSSLQEEDSGRRGRPRNRLEPMDTIFVKQVKEGGPAHGAGLCTGDRIVKVNGESIIGKTYSQVIALIQNSDAVLELCVMPKDEDILQLAYSQDAYLKGHEAYSGNAHNIPEPPPLCYPRVDPKPAGMAQTLDSALSVDARAPGPEGGRGAWPLEESAGGQADLGYRVEIPVPPSPTPPPVLRPQLAVGESGRSAALAVTVLPDVLEHGVLLSNHRAPPDPIALRPRPASATRAPQYPPAQPLDTAVFSTAGSVRTSLAGPGDPFPALPNHYLPPSSSSSSSVSPAAVTVAHQNIDWRTYKTYREYVDNKRVTRPPEEHVPRPGPLCACPRPPAQRIAGSPWRGGGGGVGLGVGARPTLSRDWPRGAPQDPKTKPRARSCDFLELDEGPGRGLERRSYGRVESEERLRQHLPGRQPLPQRATSSQHHPPPIRAPSSYGKGFRVVPVVTPHFVKGPEQLLSSGPGTTANELLNDRRAAVVNHLPPCAEVTARSASCSAPSKGPTASSNGAATALRTNGREATVAATPPGVETVVLREKPPSGRLHAPQPLRHPSYILAVNDPESEPHTAATPDSACWLPNDARREVCMKRLGEQQWQASGELDDSLDSIPFIDEPSSPSADHDATHIPASAVISVLPAITTIPPSPVAPCPLMRRQLSHDQDSLRNTILESQSGPKTERSKSYDEGLDNYREEGRVRTSVKHLTSLRGLRKALDGHKSSDDSGSRRDSSSDVFSDSSKEGWLHFRQLNTEKIKRVGGGMRQWKQMYSVLRGPSLWLYKDRKEALAHAVAAHPQPDDEPQPISIKACLIDISYSDTKRKNVLRLTTSQRDYLFQAEGREDMLSWIRVIQENSNLDDESAGVTSQDLISRKIKEYNTMMSSPSSKTEPSPKSSRQSLSIRQTLLGGKCEAKAPSPHTPRQDSERKALHKDDASPPRDRSTWRKGIPGLMRKPFEKKTPPGVTFGVRLDDCPPAQNNRFVPLIVEICCKLVEERGLEYTGIYRVPGNNAAISSMQEDLNKGMGDIDIQDDKWRDLNVISSLLKSFFRKLPEPLFTNEKYADFIEANRTEDAVERLKILKTLLHQLPDHHYETLKFLSGHLKIVAENCEKNKMEPRNLAIVFGPTLVRTSEDNMTHMVTHMPDQYKIVETLIQQYDWFFTEEGGEEPTTSFPQESAVESQPVPNIDHLLTNIGRAGLASPGDVSDSPTSDSAKSKQGSWGSGKDQYSRELLRSSIFAAASRKRKKHKEKPLPSSSDDDLDGVVLRMDPQGHNHSPGQNQNQSQSPVEPERRENGRGSEGHVPSDGHGAEMNGKQELKPPSPPATERPPRTQLPPSPSPSPSPSLSYRPYTARQSSLSDPTSQCDDATSDLGTMNSSSSQASAPPAGPGPGPAPDPRGNEAVAEVSSITSDYSTTSSLTFLTGAESGARLAACGGGDEADDERSELVSEGRPAETDSESDFPVFPKLDGTRLLAPPPAQHANVDGRPGNPPPCSPDPKGRSSGSPGSSSRSESERRGLPGGCESRRG
ncbi:hypothetical protein AAFF_G00021900 [Aldrovandia affinis]|uniref:Rho GTPase activating protein 21 n=1 Tax=Aldrovandia affinis TaxID=143900 RepID=A0AAD7WGH2_9TELE|nr:hypothetical protein AAFF_G00021900 [Aldrovandia affinis]